MSLLRNKYFYINLAVALAIAIGLVIAILLSLKSFTRHGEAIVLPNFEGQPLEELEVFVKANDLQYAIIDSVYNDDLLPGTVVLQDPYPNSTVKRGRKIYVSIVSELPESVVMPNVVNLSVRQAVSLIYGNDLTVDKLIFRTGFDKNAVQEQLVEENIVEAGTKLKKHTPVTLIVSSGNQTSYSKIPNLKGLTKEQAIQRIYQHSFNIGVVSGDKSDAAKTLKVASQIPAYSATGTYPLGYKVSFHLSENKNDTTWVSKPDAEGIDTLLMQYIEHEEPDSEEPDSSAQTVIEYEFIEEEF